MPDIADLAQGTIESTLALQQAAATSHQRPKGFVPKGHCWECEIDFDEPDGVHRQLFCAAEPGQRESDCAKSYNRRQAQAKTLGR